MKRIAIDAKDLLGQIVDVLSKEIDNTYCVGGYVRDTYIGRNTRDIDLIFPDDTLVQKVNKIVDAFQCKFFVMDENRGYYRLLIPSGNGFDFTVDVVPLGDSIEDNLAARDFTINCIALPLIHYLDLNKVIDLFGGVSDIGNRVIKQVTTEIFIDDPLRVLRAVRLSNELGFVIDNETQIGIKKHSDLLKNVSQERCRDEFITMMNLNDSVSILKTLDVYNLLIQLFPDLESARGVSQPEQHYWDVLDHSIETVGFFERMTSRNLRDKNNILERVPWIKSNDEYFQEEVNVGRSRLLLTKIAALLHDIAKPSTKKTDSAGKTRFLGHPEEGAEIAKRLMSRLKFSNREINFVSLIIEHHLRPMQLSNNLEKPSKRAIFRFKRDLKDALFSVLYLSIADYLAAKGPKLKDEQWDRRVEYCQWILSDLVDRKQNSHGEPPIITGHDLISSLELTPGPLIGLLLDEIKEAIAIGDIADKAAALEYAEKLIRKIESNEIGTDIRMEGIR